MKKFTFSKDSTILIYGCGKIGKNLFNKLTNAGYTVKGFIDKNAKELNKNGEYYIINPEELKAESSKSIIILTFQNIIEQEKIAKKLYEQGIDKIIYLNRSDDAHYMKCFELYNKLVCGEYVDEFDFPYTELHYKKTEPPFYRESGESIIVEVPDSLIFSAGKENTLKQKKNHLEEKNIVAFYHYNAVCELFLNGETNTEDFNQYCDAALSLGKTLDDFIKDRFTLFDMMQKELRKKGIEFFRNSPSTAKWNPKGYFNLIDGHHRAIFLINNFIHNIPIKISKHAYDTWYNQHYVQIIKDYILTHKIEQVYTPIIHPDFYDIKSVTESYGRTTSSAIYKYFGRKDVQKYSVLDIYSNLSYYAQVFSRMNVKKVVSLEKRKLFFNLAMLLNCLHYTKNIDMRNTDIFGIDNREKFDIVILANDIILDLSKRSSISVLEKIDGLSSKYFIWRSSTNAEEEKNYIIEKTGFRKYHLLNIEVIKGKLIEIGVYEK